MQCVLHECVCIALYCIVHIYKQSSVQCVLSSFYMCIFYCVRVIIECVYLDFVGPLYTTVGFNVYKSELHLFFFLLFSYSFFFFPFFYIQLESRAATTRLPAFFFRLSFSFKFLFLPLCTRYSVFFNHFFALYIYKGSCTAPAAYPFYSLSLLFFFFIDTSLFLCCLLCCNGRLVLHLLCIHM